MRCSDWSSDVCSSDLTVTRGRAGTPVVVLRHGPSLRHAPAGSAGLFHTAILFDSQAALAAALYSVATRAPGSFTGSADHLVRQAFYFTDPAGNGVELSWDRDRTARSAERTVGKRLVSTFRTRWLRSLLKK